MDLRHRLQLGLALLVALAGCAPGTGTSAPRTSAPPAPTVLDLTPTILDILAGEAEPFTDLEPGTYSIDPDLDPSTSLQVTFDVPVEGWSMWIGAVKSADDGHVAVSITTVTNLVSDGCRDHSWADPPVGPSVNDLAAALADLAPFRVTSPPKDVTIYGYSGKYLELTVPDLPVEGKGDDRRFTGCVDGNLKSWVAAIDTEPGDAFYGYNGEPGRTEEFWILDVDGTRLVIEANWSPASPRKDVAEMRAILGSIRIEP